MAKTAVQGKPIHKWPTGRKLLYILGLILALIAIGIFVRRAIHQHAVNAERARFVQAEQEIQSIASAITRKAGVPVIEQKDDYCSRPSEEFQKFHTKNTLCTVGRRLIYRVITAQEANDITGKIKAEVANYPSWHFMNSNERVYQLSSNSENLATIFGAFAQAADYQLKTYSYTDQRTKMNCHTDFTYFSPFSDVGNGRITGNMTGVLVELVCEQATLAAYYSVK